MGNRRYYTRYPKETPPEKAPYTQHLMLKLHKEVIAENRRQRSNEYSLRDERGKTFSLSYWNEFRGMEYVLIPAGTPINEKNLTWAAAELKKAMDACQLGRYSSEAREQAKRELGQIAAGGREDDR